MSKNEAETRKEMIDTRLMEAGWDVNKLVRKQVCSTEWSGRSPQYYQQIAINRSVEAVTLYKGFTNPKELEDTFKDFPPVSLLYYDR